VVIKNEILLNFGIFLVNVVLSTMIKGKFYLKPVDKNAPSKDCIDIPDGKTTIGRGPFLQCSEKRISRNHAIVEVKDDSMFITPIHVNPCFYHGKKGRGSLTVLTKDKPYKLESGDRISLLPDSSMYDVINESEEDAKKSLENGVSKIKPKTEELSDIEADGDDKSNNSTPKKDGRSSKKEIGNPDENEPEVLPQGEKQKKRTLPQWMLDEASDGGESKHKPASRGKKGTPKKSSPKRGKKSPSKPRKVSDEDYSQSPSEDDEKDVATPVKSKKTMKQVVKYDMSEDESDDDTPVKPKKGKKKVIEHDMSEDENDDDTPIKPKKGKKVVMEHEISDDENDDDTPVKPKKPKKHAAEHEISGDEQSDDEKSEKATPKKPKATTSNSKDSGEDDGLRVKKRRPCEFGKKCYRKNQAHLKDYSHPGDDDYTSGQESSDAGGSGSEDDRPECEFGTDCYRKNRQHRKEYKHTVRPKRRAAREVKRKTSYRERGSDEDSLESSFLDDDSNGDSSYSPDDEDIRTLKKEAKEFVRNKKMYQLRS